MDTIPSEGTDRRARHLYSIATTTKNGDLRREALLFLGALERGGSIDAARALEKIRKNTKTEKDQDG
ncbi:MAG TPA: hypothetical protein VMT31_03000 [Methanomicrobiales archaeon]|nr:hypothetical protein [Methanomicrobiales archaeon]